MTEQGVNTTHGPLQQHECRKLGRILEGHCPRPGTQGDLMRDMGRGSIQDSVAASEETWDQDRWGLWGIGNGSAHSPGGWSKEKLEEELGSAVSFPNLPTAWLATCKLNLLCSAPQSYLPLSICSPSLPSSLHIYSPLLEHKIPRQPVPYFLALERTGKLESRQKNKHGDTDVTSSLGTTWRNHTIGATLSLLTALIIWCAWS